MAKSKFVKVVIKLICGFVLVVIMTTNGIIISANKVKASTLPITQKYTIENINTVFGNSTIDMDIFNNQYANNTIKNEGDLMARLGKVGMTQNFTNTKRLMHIVKTEKRFGLDPCELLALCNTENSFTDRTIIEKDGITSYNCTQMRLPVAKVVHGRLAAKGINLPAPTENLMRNDSEYVITLTGSYLSDLHKQYPNKLQALTCYNAGEFRMNHFKSQGYKYQYTNSIMKSMSQFMGMIGDAY